MTRALQRERVKRVCEYDGAVFYVEAFRLRRSPCHWCSRNCWHKSTRTGEERQCAICGSTFYVGRSALGHRQSRWCSTKCSRIQQRKGLVRECRTCGKTFYVQRGHLKKSVGNGFYCSTRCTGPHKAELKRGIYFIGGIYRLYGANWNTQRALARERDAHTCQDCGLVRKKPSLHVHHIEARRSFGEDFERANRLENLVTLCPRCHAKREHIFAKPSNRQASQNTEA